MRMAAEEDGKVLAFGDVVLRQADVDLLQGPFWLNDVSPRAWVQRVAIRSCSAYASCMSTKRNVLILPSRSPMLRVAMHSMRHNACPGMTSSSDFLSHGSLSPTYAASYSVLL